MRAILLAAGRGRRLGIDEPKCLVQVEDRSLLERHLDCMVHAGIDELTVVIGHAHESLVAAVETIERQRAKAGRALPINVEFRFNERFVHGSIVSLQCAGDRLAEGALWMDADVLYPPELLRRLVISSHANCALLDARASETGEEMMLAAREGRLQRIARRVGPDWDLVGESVGFFKAGPEAGEVMREILDAEIAAGRLDQEHEDALNQAFDRVPFGFERVDEFPWTEIDFPEDIEKATQLAAKL